MCFGLLNFSGGVRISLAFDNILFANLPESNLRLTNDMFEDFRFTGSF